MKRTFVCLCSLIMALVLATGAGMAFAATGTNPLELTNSDGTATKPNGASSVFDGITFVTRGTNFWRGYDSEGNFCTQSEAHGSYTFNTNLACVVDSFKVTFELTPISTVDVGSYYAIGLTRTPDGMIELGIRMTYNAEGTFDLLWQTAGGNVYNPFGGAQELSQYAVGEFNKFGFNERVTLEYRYIDETAAALIDGVDAGWHVVINDVLFQIPGLDSFFVTPWAGEGFYFPTNGDGKYYGYFYYEDNYQFGNPTSNRGARLTLYDLVTGNTSSVADSVYQGVWAENENPDGLDINVTADECVIAFCEFDGVLDASIGMSEYGVVVSDGTVTREFKANLVSADGKYGIAIYGMPAGSYSVKGYVKNLSFVSYGAAVNFVVE